MAKRGRPTNKVVRKRKIARSKNELSSLVVVFIIVLVIVVGYFVLINK